MSLGLITNVLCNISKPDMRIFFPQVCGRSWLWWQLCGFTCHHQFIGWLQVDHPKFFLLISISIICISGRRIIGNSSFRDILKLFFCTKITVSKLKLIKVWWSRKGVFVQLFKLESVQGEQRTIGVIPCDFLVGIHFC